MRKRTFTTASSFDNAKPSGLLNISHAQRDMYNHGLATFVLGQAHGMTTTRDRRLNRVLDRALAALVSDLHERFRGGIGSAVPGP